MSYMWFNCFSFVLVTSIQSVFPNYKEILSAPSCSLVLADGKPAFKLFVFLHLALLNYLSISFADQKISFHGQVRRANGQLSVQLSSQCVLCLGSVFTKILCSLCAYIDKPALSIWLGTQITIVLLDWFGFGICISSCSSSCQMHIN